MMEILKERRVFAPAVTQNQYDNAIKWIEALESGTYEQGKGCLCLREGVGKYTYCCLGVANKMFNLGIAPSCGDLGDVGMNYLGLSLDNVGMLTTANDVNGLDFKEIATLLREELAMAEVKA